MFVYCAINRSCAGKSGERSGKKRKPFVFNALDLNGSQFKPTVAFSDEKSDGAVELHVVLLNLPYHR